MDYEIAMACGIHGVEDKCLQIFVVKPEIK
jgi:hypothetical protein